MGLAQFAKRVFNCMSTKNQVEGGKALSALARHSHTFQKEMEGNLITTDMATLLSIHNARSLGNMDEVQKVTSYLHGKPLGTVSALVEEASSTKNMLVEKFPWLKDPDLTYAPLPKGSSSEEINKSIKDLIHRAEQKYGTEHKIERTTVERPLSQKPKAQDIGL